MTAPTIRGQPASTRATPGGQRAQAQRQAFRRRKATAKARNETRRKNEAAQVEAMPVLRPHACGIDVGSRSHWACVGFAAAADTGLVREVPAHPPGLKDLPAFLREPQVQTAATESPGRYWRPLDRLLLGAAVRAASGGGLRGPPGRPQLQPPTARPPQDGPARLPVDLPAALRRPAGRGLPPRRADLPAAGLPATAGQPGPLGQPARAAHAEGPGANEPEADRSPQR